MNRPTLLRILTIALAFVMIASACGQAATASHTSTVGPIFSMVPGDRVSTRVRNRHPETGTNVFT